MRTQIFARYTFGVGAALVLAACGQSAPPLAAPAAQAEPTASWVSPEARASDLLYVSDTNRLSIYTYPNGRPVGVIKNPDFPLLGGACVDSAGDVFVSSLGSGKIFEYKHGSKTLLQTLAAPAGGAPLGCAVDPLTGNLAVASIANKTQGNIAVYQHAQGAPTVLTAPHIRSYFFCSYDGSGNLFVDGIRSGGGFQLAELPAGSGAFADISLKQRIRMPGAVMWDGTHLAIGDQMAAAVYEFGISGSKGTLVHTTPIDGETGDRAFWIQGSSILVANRVGIRTINFFAYPGGGNPTKSISKALSRPFGLTVSLAPSR
jgi:hypothetical protein